MASVSVDGSGVYVSAPVLGDRSIPVETGAPVSGVVFLDPSQTVPQAEVRFGVTSVGGVVVGAAANPEAGAVQVRADDGNGHSVNQVFSQGSAPAYVDSTGGIFQAGVNVGGYYVAVAGSPEGQAMQVRAGDADGESVNQVLASSAAPVYTDTTGGIYQAGVNVGGYYVAVAGSPEGQAMQVRAGDADGESVNQVFASSAAPVYADTTGGIFQATVVTPANGAYVAVAVNPDAQGMQVRAGDADGESVNNVYYAPAGGGGGEFPPELPSGEVPTIPGFPPELPDFSLPTGADTVQALGSVADLGNATLLGAGALTSADPFASAIGGGLVNLGNDSLASSAIAGSFVQDQALHQLVAPTVETNSAAPATGSVLSLDDGLTTITLQGFGKHS